MTILGNEAYCLYFFFKKLKHLRKLPADAEAGEKTKSFSPSLLLQDCTGLCDVLKQRIMRYASEMCVCEASAATLKGSRTS